MSNPFCYTETEDGVTAYFFHMDDLQAYMSKCHDAIVDVKVFGLDDKELKYTCDVSTDYKPLLEPLEDED